MQKMVCHGQHTYVYSSVLLQVLSSEHKGGVNIKRLQQEITKVAQKKSVLFAKLVNICIFALLHCCLISRNDITAITMALNGAACYPQACQALSSMLSRNNLNPADITVLFRNFSASDPPPIDLIRIPLFLGKFSVQFSSNGFLKLYISRDLTVFLFAELLVDSLFKPGVKLNPEHKPKYIYLLAYAASVYEISSSKKPGVRKSINKDELKSTTQAIDKVHTICYNNKGSTELIAEITTLFQYIRLYLVNISAKYFFVEHISDFTCV